MKIGKTARAEASVQSSFQKSNFDTTRRQKLRKVRYQSFSIYNIGNAQFFRHCFKVFVRDCRYQIQGNGQKILEYMNLQSELTSNNSKGSSGYNISYYFYVEFETLAG